MDDQNKTFKERQREQKLPLQYAIFKGVTGKFGALRLNLKKAYVDNRRDKDDGCIFLEMVSTKGPNNYDWENSKIVMALSIIDIPKIIMYLRAPQHPMFEKTDYKLKIYHDRDAGTSNKGQNVTNIMIDKPKDKDNFFFNAFQKKGEITKQASVPVSPDEAVAIGTLLQAAIPLILAWD